MRHGKRQAARVAFVINDLLLGGAQAAVLGIASGLDRTEFEPVVYYLNTYPKERQSMTARFIDARIPIKYIGSEGKTSIAGTLPRLLRLWHRDRPDLVHLHLPDAVIAGSMAAIALRIPFIIHEQQTQHMHTAKIRLAYRLLRSKAALTLCYSPVIENEIFGTDAVLSNPLERIERRSYTVYNGIDISQAESVRGQVDRTEKRLELGIPSDAFVITSVARLIPWKGQRTLLEAFARISSVIPDAHLCLVGEGVLEEELRARAAALKLSDRVHLLGPRTDVYEILRASDVGSLAFIYEGDRPGESIGIAGFEMMGLGLPLIASEYPSARAYGTVEQVVLLVPPGDTSALAKTLIELSSDPEKRLRIGKNSAEFVRKNLDWRSIVPIYEKIYQLLIRP